LGFVASSTKEVDQMWKKLKNFPGIKLSSKKWHRDKSYGFYFTDTEANSLEWIYIPTVPIYENQNQNELVVLLVHGSKSKKWSLEFDKLVKRIKIEDKQKIWVVAHLEGVKPKINQVIETSLNKYSFNKIKIIPLLFSNGVHMRRDVIAEVRLLKKSFPKFKIILKKSLLEENIFTDFLIDYLLLS
jgi:cobalamin biosynthesis Co2+ chelatase CbiK